jgi:hypothetical protein
MFGNNVCGVCRVNGCGWGMVYVEVICAVCRCTCMLACVRVVCFGEDVCVRVCMCAFVRACVSIRNLIALFLNLFGLFG